MSGAPPARCPLWRPLCRLEEIADGGAKEFPPLSGSHNGLFAIRRREAVFVYENACPHIGVPLNWAPDRFLDARGRHIVCGTHGALFRIEDGMCFKGPCTGMPLTAIPFRVVEGVLEVEEDAA